MRQDVGLGERLRQARKDAELSQEELGRRVGLAKQTISSYEHEASSPDPDMLRKLAETLHVSADYLLGLSDLTQEAQVGLHRTDGYDKPLPPEAVASIEEFIEFIRKKYGPRPDQPKEADRGKDRKPEGPGEE